ncbi:MAG: helix-turn-helix transcriptional regulator [Actinobacteria bacterium]|nr:helix-turn-helix transcriptional regulator [Actinomycetota bacterium]MBO0834071.1 helix-turn-helix transcriptional regulator [Actinomycetota bacterium]
MSDDTVAATGLSGAVGRTVAGLRAERGWSLDKLAGRSGVSKGVLVALEQGRSNPNLATLARIGDAFGVPVTRLLESADESAVRVSGQADSRVLWRGPAGGTGTIVAATPPPWAAELWEWQLEPGEKFGGEAHAPGTRELAYVQSGELTVTVAGSRYLLGPGECARFPGDLQHRYANESDGPISMTMVVVVPPAVG